MADRRLPLLAALLLAGSLSCSAEAKRLPPRDEYSADPRLRAFIGTLRATVARKDAPALLRLLSPDIKTDFGGGGGIADFRTRWQLDQGAASPVWRELDRALALGCAREKSYAAIPYLFIRMDQAIRNGGDDDIDPFNTFLATGTGIAVRAAPDTKARKIDTLDWDIRERGPASRRRLAPDHHAARARRICQCQLSAHVRRLSHPDHARRRPATDHQLRRGGLSA